jgi:hypothetical protein
MNPSSSSASSPLSSPIILDPLLLPPPALADDYTIPPPPNLKRKIIQVSPGTSGARAAKMPRTLRPKPTPAAAATSAATTTRAANASALNEEKLKISEKRKHARKTAHSEIERRRRSKINMQFDALKELVPACHNNNNTGGNGSGNGGNGLHKLVILQATVEYIRYLKDCLEIKTNHQQKQQQQQIVTPPQSNGPMPVTDASSCGGNLVGNSGSGGTNVFPPSPNLQEPSPRIRVSDLIS